MVGYYKHIFSHKMTLTAKEKKVLADFFEKKISLRKAQQKLGYKSYTTVYQRTVHLLRTWNV